MKERTNGKATPAWHAGFLALLPAVKKQAAISFRHLPPDAKEEAISEAVAAALVAYVRLAEQGRLDVVYATPLAKYAVLHVRNSRKVGGREANRDVFSRKAQQRHGFEVEHLESCDSYEDKWVEQVVVEDRHASPADTAAVRIDFGEWLRMLSRRNRRIAKALAKGETTKAAAAKFGITAGRISQLRGELEESWEEFQQQAAEA